MGVCGGLADAVNMDATLMRIIWVAAAFMTTILPVVAAYFVLGILLPESGSGHKTVEGKKAWTLAAAVVLITAGILIIADNIIDIPVRQYVLPVALMGGGILLLIWAIKKNDRK